jgi:hypothetical protein
VRIAGGHKMGLARLSLHNFSERIEIH